MDLAWLIDPTDRDTFKRDYWESKPLVSLTNSSSRFAELLSLAAVDEILCHSSLRSDDVQVTRNGQSMPFHSLAEIGANDAEGGLEGLYQEYRKGSSIVLLFLHERWPPLKALCQSLSSELSARIQANLYLTPPHAQALKTHYDTHDVLVLQLHGKKRWRVFEPTVHLPLAYQPHTADSGNFGSPTMELTLCPGDLLYLPRGYPHDAQSKDGASLHLTIGLVPITWASVIMRTVRSAIDENWQLRKSLPPGFASDPELSAKAVTRLGELMTDLLDGANAARAIEQAGADARRLRPPSLAGHLLDMEAVPDIGLETPFRCRSGTEVSLTSTDDKVGVLFHSKIVEFPAYVEKDLRFILDADQFTPCELPGKLDPKSRLLLISRLVTEGLLKIIEYN